MTDEKKPRVRFCWWCGRQLRGNHFVEKEVEGHLHILHKTCAERPDMVMRDDEELENR